MEDERYNEKLLIQMFIDNIEKATGLTNSQSKLRMLLAAEKEKTSWQNWRN